MSNIHENYWFLRNFANNQYIHFDGKHIAEVKSIELATPCDTRTEAARIVEACQKDYPQMKVVNYKGALA